jgi:hypothetical protein
MMAFEIKPKHYRQQHQAGRRSSGDGDLLSKKCQIKNSELAKTYKIYYEP